MDQLAGAVRSVDLKLDAPAMQKIDEIWPGPGKPAPEAWAW
jgi:hypothetical protein